MRPIGPQSPQVLLARLLARLPMPLVSGPSGSSSSGIPELPSMGKQEAPLELAARERPDIWGLDLAGNEEPKWKA